ncbi:hypothetical protein KIP69_00310 [Geobacter sulfurreducens]|uniref:hypothetical protein n=1 Tax=Geobacter sulfurreducens TaxID=35554 RepID=UPI001BDCBDD1|nr:hypothetical protein [Geobacter sulfurreducens]QVW35328.1 hypothetical protein KIP69_00310 [Geobacter sulfurreducens]
MVTADTPFEQKKLGRKHIKSFASGIAHMFACSAQHYAWLAYQHQLLTVAIDLLELRIEPSEFDIERNRTLASMCQRTLLRNAGQLAPPGCSGTGSLDTSLDYAAWRISSGDLKPFFSTRHSLL